MSNVACRPQKPNWVVKLSSCNCSWKGQSPCSARILKTRKYKVHWPRTVSCMRHRMNCVFKDIFKLMQKETPETLKNHLPTQQFTTKAKEAASPEEWGNASKKHHTDEQKKIRFTNFIRTHVMLPDLKFVYIIKGLYLKERTASQWQTQSRKCILRK